MDWDAVIPVALKDSERIAERVALLRGAAHSFVEEKAAAYFWDPATDRVGICARPNVDYAALLKIASVFGPVRAVPISPEEISASDSSLVKVGYSQALRSLGESLNFFPGHYPGGIPNHPSPLAAMLTSGLAGAGLGWGAGKLFEKILPEGYGNRLSRTGMILGGGLGAGLGGMWGVSNAARGRPFNDNTLFQGPVDPVAPAFSRGIENIPAAEPEPFPGIREYLNNFAPPSSPRHKMSADLDVELNPLCAGSIDHFVKLAFGTLGSKPQPRESSPLDVNIGALGQTLWDVSAPPALTAATVGTLYAASQLPDARGQPGWATMGQLGQLAERSGGTYQQGSLIGLATNAVADYLTGTIGGVAANTLVGTPYKATTYGAINAGLGMLGRVIGSLWG